MKRNILITWLVCILLCGISYGGPIESSDGGGSAGGDYIPTSYLDTDGTMAANSDTKVATQQATKEYADTKLDKTDAVFTAPTELTIASDAITITQSTHYVDTAADAASDDLVTISGGAVSGVQVLFLRAAHTDRTVVLKETGNIIIPYGSQLSLDSTSFWVQLVYDTDLSKWVVVGSLPDTVDFSAVNLASGTLTLPQGTAAAPTTEGQIYHNTSTDVTTIGNGASADQVSKIAAAETLTNKTIDVDGTGNVIKSWGYLILTHPHLCAAGAPMQTTTTANTFGQCKYGNATDKATNYAEYYLVIPADVDTSVDLTATFKIQLSDTDTGDHEYEISFDSVANSAAYAGSLGDPISLAYTADASGAANDVETAGETTLTGWRAAMTAGNLMVIRVARDGDHANDGSTVDSYSGPLVIKYKITQ